MMVSRSALCAYFIDEMQHCSTRTGLWRHAEWFHILAGVAFAAETTFSRFRCWFEVFTVSVLFTIDDTSRAILVLLRTNFGTATTISCLALQIASRSLRKETIHNGTDELRPFGTSRTETTDVTGILVFFSQRFINFIRVTIYVTLIDRQMLQVIAVIFKRAFSLGTLKNWYASDFFVVSPWTRAGRICLSADKKSKTQAKPGKSESGIQIASTHGHRAGTS